MKKNSFNYLWDVVVSDSRSSRTEEGWKLVDGGTVIFLYYEWTDRDPDKPERFIHVYPDPNHTYAFYESGRCKKCTFTEEDTLIDSVDFYPDSNNLKKCYELAYSKLA